MSMRLGKIIRLTRELRDMSLEEVAGKMGYTPQWLSNVERGTRVPKLRDLLRLAEILNVSPAVFLARDANELLKLLAAGRQGGEGEAAPWRS